MDCFSCKTCPLVMMQAARLCNCNFVIAFSCNLDSSVSLLFLSHLDIILVVYNIHSNCSWSRPWCIVTLLMMRVIRVICISSSSRPSEREQQNKNRSPRDGYLMNHRRGGAVHLVSCYRLFVYFKFIWTSKVHSICHCKAFWCMPTVWQPT